MNPSRDAQPSDEQSSLHDLMVECLSRMDAEGDRAIEEVCKAHPEHASALRAQLQKLNAIGMLQDQHADPPPVPQRIGSYHIRQQIGRGGMGVVYLAEHEQNCQRAAFKLVRAEVFLASDKARDRFDREVEVISRLAHDNVVALLDHGEHDGQPFFAMEFVEGVSLDEVVRQCKGRDPAALHGRDLWELLRGDAPREPRPAWLDRPWTELVADLMAQVAEAVIHAHERGVVHRDLKPGNVMLTAAGQVKVLDFGLALLAGSSRLTSTVTPLGSLPYLSPEQVAGDLDDIGPHSDIYAMGVMMYELLTLRLPFWESSPPKVLERILRGAPPRPRSLNSAMDESSEWICLKAMDVETRHRYGDARAFLEDVRCLQGGRTVTARPPRLGRRLRRWCRRHPRTAVMAAATVLVVGSFAAFLTERNRRETMDETVQTEALARRGRLLESVDRLLRLSTSSLQELPREGQEARVDSLETACDLWEPVLAEEPDDLDSRRTWGRLHRALGVSLLDLGRITDAEREFQVGARYLEGCLVEDPADQGTRLDLAAVLHGQARCHVDRRDLALALAAVEQCLQHYDRMSQEPSRKLSVMTNRIAAMGTRLRVMRRMDRPLDRILVEATVAAARAGLRLPESTEDLRSESLTALAAASNWYLTAGAVEESRSLAQEILDGLPEEPAGFAMRMTRGGCADLLAQAWEAQGAGDCAALHELAIDSQRELVRDLPDNPILRGNLAVYLSNRGVCRLRGGDRSGVGDLEESLAVLAELASKQPGNPAHAERVAMTQANLAQSWLESDPARALESSLDGIAPFLLSPLEELRGEQRAHAVTLIHTAAIAHARLQQLEEGFQFLEAHGESVSEDHPWFLRLIADCWNEWCLAYRKAPDPSALEVEAELAKDLMFEFLRRAVEAGYRDRSELESTEALAPFREDQRFQEVLAAAGKAR